MFNITVVIHGLFRTHEEDTHHPHDPEEIDEMAYCFARPSMFRSYDWEIIDTDSQEVLVSWDSANERLYNSKTLFNARVAEFDECEKHM